MPVFAEGVQRGAPQARQVADRWHLFQNLWDALVVVFGQHLTSRKQLIPPVTPASPDERPVKVAVRQRRRPPAPPSAIEQARAERRAHWEAMFAQVHVLLAQGMKKPAIAKQLGISERVVRKYSHMTYLPKKQSPKYGPRLIDPYRDALREYLAAGPITIAKLHRLLQAQGFTGSRAPIYQAVRQLRAEWGVTDGSSPMPRRAVPVSPQQLATWVLQPTPSVTLQDWIQHVRAQHPTLDLTMGLAQDFATFVRQHKPHHLANRIEAVELAGVRALTTFARGLLRDFDAICAACTEPWSNGPVEGHVNRIKLIKRQMYGRATFDLLRLRVLYNGTLCT